MNSRTIRIRGRVKNILYGRDCGFIQSVNEAFPEDCFFGAQELTDVSIHDLEVGDLLEFSRVDGRPESGRGCRHSAVSIRRAAEPRFGAYTKRGGSHSLNEDEFLIDVIIPDARVLAVVADGLSNPPNTGWWASSEAITILVREIRQSALHRDQVPLSCDPDKRRDEARQLINAVQKAFKREQQKMTDDRRKGKTTLAIAVGDADSFVWAAGGDSFILDIDFSSGFIKYVAGSRQERTTSTVLSPVGDREAGWNPRVGHRRLGAGHGLLLCSDGIALDKIGRFVTADLEHQEVCRKIVEHSIEEIGRDDATCVLLSWSVPALRRNQ